MATVGLAGRTGESTAAGVRGAPLHVRAAFDALVAGAPKARPLPGGLAPPRVSGAAREGWLDGIREALAELPVLAFGVTPGALLLGDVVVLDSTGRPYASALHGGGLRSFLIFAGAPEHELLALAGVVLTDWSQDPGGTELLATTWGLETPHLHFDVEVRSQGRSGIPFGPAVRALDLVEQAPTALQRRGPLSSERMADLLAWRGTIAPDPGRRREDVPFAASAELQAEVALVREGVDILPGELGAALVASMTPDLERRERVAGSLLAAAVELLGSSLEVSPLVHHALETVDADLSPFPEERDEVRSAYSQLGRDPLRTRLAEVLPTQEAPDLRGPLFSLFSLLSDPEAVASLAQVLPRWAVAILADTVLLREQDDAPHRHERVRSRLSSAHPGELSLGLAMASRLEDPRLTDALLGLAAHRAAEVREGALIALRQHSSPRVKELALKRLADEAGPVRVEALRYAVAHRLPELVPWLEQRLADPNLESADESEIRAVCISYGRVGRDHSEALLLEIASGKRRSSGTTLPGLALHGLRASGSARARAYLEHIATEVPRLREEATALLEEHR